MTKSAHRKAEWLDPDRKLLRRGRQAPPALPVEALGNWAEWIVQKAETVGAPPDYLAMPLLAGAAALIGNARRVSPWHGWTEPSILWIGNVGDASSGKSPGADPVIALLREVEREGQAGFEDALRDWEARSLAASLSRKAWTTDVEKAVKQGSEPDAMPASAVSVPMPKPPRILIGDSTPERLGTLLAENPKGLLNHRDELAGLILNFNRYNGKGGERQFWLEAFGGRFFVIDRVKEGGSVLVPHLSVSIFGGIQPDRLSSLLLEAEDDGLVARFLWSWPDPVPPRRPTVHVPSEAQRLALLRLADLTMISEQGRDRAYKVIRLCQDAAYEFQAWRVGHTARSLGVAGMIDTAWGKLPGILLRLSLVLEYLEWSLFPQRPEPEEVSLAALLGAVQLVEDYFKGMLTRVHGDAGLPKPERDAATLARWIAHGGHEWINTRELQRDVRLPGLKDNRSIMAAIEVLVEAHWLRRELVLNGGRPRSDYTVNPKVRALVSRPAGL